MLSYLRSAVRSFAKIITKIICCLYDGILTVTGNKELYNADTNLYQPNELIQAILDRDKPKFDFAIGCANLTSWINKKVKATSLHDHHLPGYISETSAICRASHRGSVDTLRTLVEKGACLYNVNSMGESALHSASIDSTYGIRKSAILLKSDPQIINSKNKDGQTPLHVSAKCGILPMVEYLVEHQSELIHHRDNFDALPIHHAARKGYAQCVEVFLTKGVCPDSVGDIKMTPMSYAAREGRLKTLQILHKYKANVEKRAENGRVSLHFAAKEGYIDCLKFLLDECNANINVADNNMCTPLILASKRGDISLVKVLVSNEECDLNYADKCGKSAIEIAEENQHVGIVAYLSEEINLRKQNSTNSPALQRSEYDQPDEELPSCTRNVRNRGANIRQAIRENMQWLKCEIDPAVHLACLFQGGAITESEMETIQKLQKIQSTEDTAMSLLTILFKKKNDTWAAVLLESFENHCPHVEERINTSLSTLDSK